MKLYYSKLEKYEIIIIVPLSLHLKTAPTLRANSWHVYLKFSWSLIITFDFSICFYMKRIYEKMHNWVPIIKLTCDFLYPPYPGRWPDEAAAKLLVGHAGARPPAPADTQQPARWDDAAQRPEVRSTRPRLAWRAAAVRTLQRAAAQAGWAEVRRWRLHLHEVPAAAESRRVNETHTIIGYACKSNTILGLFFVAGIQKALCLGQRLTIWKVSWFVSDFADVRGITNKKTVLEGYENVQAALLDYTLTCYSSVTVSILPPFLSYRIFVVLPLLILDMFRAGQVQQADQYYPRDPCDGRPWRGASVRQALRRKCTDTDPAHGDAARQTEISSRLLLCTRPTYSAFVNLLPRGNSINQTITTT